jgi:Arc/MetJ family transcription regulator
MKTTVEIDEALLKEAQKALGTTSIKGTVEASLRVVVRQRQLQALADALGTIDLDLTPERLRRHRATLVHCDDDFEAMKPVLPLTTVDWTAQVGG